MGSVACQTNPLGTFQFPESIVATGMGIGTIYSLTSCGVRTIQEGPSRSLWNCPSLTKDKALSSLHCWKLFSEQGHLQRLERFTSGDSCNIPFWFSDLKLFVFGTWYAAINLAFFFFFFTSGNNERADGLQIKYFRIFRAGAMTVFLISVIIWFIETL